MKNESSRPEHLLTKEEVAERVGRSTRTVQRWAADEVIPCLRPVGNRLLFEWDKVVKALRKREEEKRKLRERRKRDADRKKKRSKRKTPRPRKPKQRQKPTPPPEPPGEEPSSSDGSESGDKGTPPRD